jgi:hypothetical protein
VPVESLIFVLKGGTTPQPVERAYLDGFDKDLFAAASLTPYGLELTISHCANQARSAVGSHGHPLDRVEREWLSTNEAGAGR